MGYCIMKISKIKSFSGMGGLGDRYRHNMRLYEVDNADPTKASLNRELLDITDRDYEESFYKNIEDYKKLGVETKIRKNAILAFEIMMTYSNCESDMDINKWCQANLKWLDDTFNDPLFSNPQTDTKANNVISAVLHVDETTPHIHAIVIPRDEYGHLNGTKYVENASKMRELQSRYSEYMKDFGLDRGLLGSVSEHVQIKDFYASLGKVYSEELPLPLNNESIDAYRARANEEYLGYRLKAHATELSLQRQIDEEKTKNLQEHNASNLMKRLEKEIDYDDYQEPYSTILNDVKNMELLKRNLKNNLENQKLKDAVEQCKEAIEQQKQLELMRDAVLFRRDHKEYDPYSD